MKPNRRYIVGVARYIKQLMPPTSLTARNHGRKESPADTLSVYALVNVSRILNCVPIGRAVPIKGCVAIANHRPVDVGYKIRQAMLDHVIPATPQFSK